MKKHLFYPALWGILTLSIFYSCRTDSVATEQTQQVNEKIAAFERFEKANNIIQPKASSKNNASSEKYVSYAAPFSEIITNFLEKHSDYRERLEKEIGKIRLDVSSTTFGEGAKGVLFPVTDKNGKVIGAWAGMVNEERDYVKFYYLNNSSQEVASIKNAFQSYYDRNKGKLASLATASKSTSLNPIAKKDVTEIEEVVITVTKPDTNIDLPWWWYDSGWTNPNPNPDGPGTGMDGGPGVHGGGTNGTENNNQQKDPCSSMKAQAGDAKFQEKISNIDNDKVLGYDHEMGYAAGYPPKGTGITDTQYPPMDNKPGTTSVKLPDGNSYYGFAHTHNNFDKNGDAPIKIFSPGDIATFLTSCVRNADENGSMGDAFAMVITSQGNYILKYSGDGNYGIGPNQIQNWKTSYEKIFNSLTIDELSDQKIIEKTFAQFLKDIVKVDGLEVYQSDKKTGTTSKINADGTKTPC